MLDFILIYFLISAVCSVCCLLFYADEDKQGVTIGDLIIILAKSPVIFPYSGLVLIYLGIKFIINIEIFNGDQNE